MIAHATEGMHDTEALEAAAPLSSVSVMLASAHEIDPPLGRAALFSM